MKNFDCIKPDLEICLCSRCASVYYDSKNYHIERKSMYQDVLDPCDICKNPHGYDFLIWNLASVQNTNSHVCGGRRK